MSNANQELLPYLNPEFWDGLMIGSSMPVHPELFSIRMGREKRFGTRELVSRLKQSQNNKYFPLEDLGRGAEFDPLARQIGTMVLFRHDTLTASAQSIRELVGEGNDYGQMPLKRGDVAASLRFKDKDDGVLIGSEDESVRFNSIGYWGIVAENEKDGKGLYAFSTLAIKQIGSRYINTVPLTRKFERPIKVGQVSHSFYDSTGAEMLARVNNIKVVANGYPEKKAEKVLVI